MHGQNECLKQMIVRPNMCDIQNDADDMWPFQQPVEEDNVLESGPLNPHLICALWWADYHIEPYILFNSVVVMQHLINHDTRT